MVYSAVAILALNMTTADNKRSAAEAGAVTLEKLLKLGNPVDSTASDFSGSSDSATSQSPYEIAA